MNYIKSILTTALALSPMSAVAPSISNDLRLSRSTIAPTFEEVKFISIGINGGESSLHFDPDCGDRSLGGGGSFSIDYNQFFNRNWGITAGLGASLSNSKISLDDTLKYEMKDVENNQELLFKVIMDGWTEKQRSVQLDIPIGALFRHNFTNRLTFMASAGVKLSFPLRTKYEVLEGSYETKGYYKKTGVEIDDLPHHGFLLTDPRPASKIPTKVVSASLFLDATLINRLNRNINIFYGVFAALGVTDNGKSHDDAVVDPNRKYTSVMASDKVDRFNVRNFGLRAGIKIPISFFRNRFGKYHHSSY